MADIRTHQGSGFAVCIHPSALYPEQKSWLTENGGYRAQRRERHVWAQRWEALEAAKGWSDCKPVVVKVHFYVRSRPVQPSSNDTEK